MDWSALLAVLLPAILLIGSGYLIRFRKANWLIAGCSTMPADKKRTSIPKNLDT